MKLHFHTPRTPTERVWIDVMSIAFWLTVGFLLALPFVLAML